MWEQIRANRRKSVFLILLMASLLVGLGYAIGIAAAGPEAGVVGVVIAVVLWVILTLTALGGGDSIMLATAGARRVEKSDVPQLVNVVEEMTIAAGLPRPPEIYVIDSDVPNAFAVGLPNRAAVAVTTGLLGRLNRDELQGVVAHEIGHIKNHDTRFIVLAGVMVGVIVLIADIFLRSVFYGGMGGRSRRSSRDGGQAQAVFMIVALVLAVLAPIFAQLLYFACSRKREYLADASGARFTRYPEGLASALEKISGAVGQAARKSTNRVVAPMYIVNPLAAHGVAGLWSTHPPTEKRIQILRAMGGGASYTQYEAAYRTVTGGAGVMGASALTDTTEVSVRSHGVPAETMRATSRREAKDAILRHDGYRFAQCPCGTRVKVPPVFRERALTCPSCGKPIPIPS